MIIVTTDQIEGKRIVKTLGLVRGSTIRARHLGHDFMAYTTMIFTHHSPAPWSSLDRLLGPQISL